jgi:hypothetical protein
MRVLLFQSSRELRHTKNPHPDPLPEYMERERRAIAATKRYTPFGERGSRTRETSWAIG